MNRKKGLSLKLNNGIRLDDYNRMLKEQNESCAVCLIPAAEFNKRLAVDHNHMTGQIRGLLCTRCNIALGYVRDNKSVLKRLIDYLTIHDS
jgi:Recombination endonuclease VII